MLLPLLPWLAPLQGLWLFHFLGTVPFWPLGYGLWQRLFFLPLLVVPSPFCTLSRVFFSYDSMSFTLSIETCSKFCLVLCSLQANFMAFFLALIFFLCNSFFLSCVRHFFLASSRALLTAASTNSTSIIGALIISLYILGSLPPLLEASLVEGIVFLCTSNLGFVNKAFPYFVRYWNHADSRMENPALERAFSLYYSVGVLCHPAFLLECRFHQGLLSDPNRPHPLSLHLLLPLLSLLLPLPGLLLLLHH